LFFHFGNVVVGIHFVVNKTRIKVGTRL
jgi:hypothetical protein